MSKNPRERAKKEKTTYLGGEWDRPEYVTPKVFERFLKKKAIFGVLGILVLFAVLVMALEVLL